MSVKLPQSPLKDGGQEYFYPLTHASQIVVGDNVRRLEMNGQVTADNSYLLGGVAPEEYLLREDAATDSAMLGGKAPEYYIQPRNLLDNSDFRNPVNQRDAGGSYGAWGGYTIDRWLAYADGATINLTNQGLSLYKSIYQPTGADTMLRYNGKPLTYSVKIDGVVYVASGIFEQTGAWHMIQRVDTPYGYIAFEVENDNKLFCIISNNISAATIEWAALYEGEYTADTLPPYVPKGYANELLACKVYDTTGVDADTLGGKAPEYYLATQELLASSNYARGASVEFSDAPDSYTYIFGRLKYAGTPHSVGASGGSTRQFQLSSVSGDDNYVYINTALLVGEQYGTTFVLNNIETTTINKSTGAISVTQPGSIQVGPIWGVK